MPPATPEPSPIAAPLRDPTERAKIAFPVNDDAKMDLMVTLNLRYAGGVSKAFEQLRRLWLRVTGAPAVHRPVNPEGSPSIRN